MSSSRTSDGSQDNDREKARRRIRELEERVAQLEAASRETRSREARFRIVSELVTDCCWARWRSADGKEERGWVNDAFTELTGYTPEEFEQVGRQVLVHPYDLDRVQEFINGPIGVSEHEFRIVRKDGEVRWLHERMRVVEDNGGLTVYGATSDITGEKRARKVLLEHRQQLERRVAERTAELVVVNEQLEREVKERRQIAAELRSAKEAAEASNRAKSRFLATMTHELRTPLHGIIGLADLLLEADLPPDALSWVRTLQSSASELRHLVQEVLDLSKIEAEQLVVEQHRFSPRELVEDLARLMNERVKQRSNELTCHVDDALPSVLVGDPARLRQVLLNLLDNAVKFTENGSIGLRLEAAGREKDGFHSVRFRVHDTGIGIDPEFRERLFDPFTQADPSTTRRYGGTGLGLAISHRLVELLGGELELDSNPGQGSVFSFVLDLEAAGAEPASDEPDGIQGDGRRILVAEDNPVNQMVVREQLEDLGFHVDLTGDGQEALEALAGRGYAAWLLDCHMPVMDGFEAVKRWRDLERSGRRLPVIAVTASAVRDELDACLEAGMDDLLTKPFRRQDLAAMLSRWLD